MIMPIAEIQLPAVLFQLKGIDFETPVVDSRSSCCRWDCVL